MAASATPSTAAQSLTYLKASYQQQQFELYMVIIIFIMFLMWLILNLINIRIQYEYIFNFMSSTSNPAMKAYNEVFPNQVTFSAWDLALSLYIPALSTYMGFTDTSTPLVADALLRYYASPEQLTHCENHNEDPSFCTLQPVHLFGGKKPPSSWALDTSNPFYLIIPQATATEAAPEITTVAAQEAGDWNALFGNGFIGYTEWKTQSPSEVWTNLFAQTSLPNPRDCDANTGSWILGGATAGIGSAMGGAMLGAGAGPVGAIAGGLIGFFVGGGLNMASSYSAKMNPCKK